MYWKCMGNDPVGIVAACSMGRACVCTAGIHQPAKCLAFSATSLGTRLWQATCVQPSTSLPSRDMTVLQSVTCFLNHTCCCCSDVNEYCLVMPRVIGGACLVCRVSFKLN